MKLEYSEITKASAAMEFSDPEGRLLLNYSAESNLKRILLELGGKYTQGAKATCGLMRHPAGAPRSPLRTATPR